MTTFNTSFSTTTFNTSFSTTKFTFCKFTTYFNSKSYIMSKAFFYNWFKRILIYKNRLRFGNSITLHSSLKKSSKHNEFLTLNKLHLNLPHRILSLKYSNFRWFCITLWLWKGVVLADLNENLETLHRTPTLFFHLPSFYLKTGCLNPHPLSLILTVY